MGCCEHEVEEEEKHTFKEYDERSCSDLIPLLAFIVSFIGIIYCFSDAGARGANTDYVLKGMDWQGDVCEHFAAWPSLNPDSYLIKICVEDCSETSNADLDNGILVNYESEDYIYYCIPSAIANILEDDNSTEDSALQELIDEFGLTSGFAAAISDLYICAWAIFASFFIAFIVSFAFTKVVDMCGAAMVLFFSLGTVVGLGICGYYLYGESVITRDAGDTDTADAMMIAAYVIWGMDALLFLILCYLRQRIILAIKIVAVAGQALDDMPLLLLFPLIPFAVAATYFMVWCYLAIYIASVGNFSEEMEMPDEFLVDSFWADKTHVDYEWDDSMEAVFGYVFFHLLWMTQFLVYFNYLVCAGAICHWYFVPPNADDEKDLPAAMILNSVKRTCRYNLGSIALGSFIIACVQFMRACIMYIEAQVKEQSNDLMKCVFRCIKCCLWCVECCLDKLAQNGYVWIAVRGGNFCSGSCKAFTMLLSNIGRTTALVWVEGALLFLGKAFVASVTTLLGVAIVWQAYTIDSLILPAVLIFAIGLMVGHFFMVMYDVAIDSIFLCMLMDEKDNNGSPQFGTKKLQTSFKETSDEIEKHVPDKHKKGGKGEPVPMEEKTADEGEGDNV